MNLKLLKKLCQLTQAQLLDIMADYLRRYYDKVIVTSNYIVAEGQLPVALVAHLDTVGKVPPQDIYYDQEKTIMWSPQLLGADDRAGVFAIINIIQDGYRPHIIFTCDEEIGCVGAMTLAQDCKGKSPFKKLKALIQLDRRGEDDSVYYDCDNKKFEKFINSYGFITNLGTFSDISVLGPTFGVAAVNLSIGYLNEHNPIETLNTTWMETTIEKVKNIIIDIDSYEIFKYIKSKNGYYPLFTPISFDEKTCPFCGGPMTKKNKVYTRDGFYLCKKCYKECY